MLFKELIDLLKQVKDVDNMPNNLFDELINAALGVGVKQLLNEHPDMDYNQAIKTVQAIVIEHTNAIIENEG